MAEFEHECGCKTIIRETLESRWAEFIECPRHAAADAMYEAAKNLLLQCLIADGCGELSSFVDGVYLDEMQAAIALADGDGGE